MTKKKEPKKKSGGEITLAEHAARIAHLGGKASMRNRTAAERREFAAQGGQASGKARLTALTPEHRSAIARKAAAARWGKRGKGD
jgi:hypothetical protein